MTHPQYEIDPIYEWGPSAPLSYDLWIAKKELQILNKPLTEQHCNQDKIAYDVKIK